MSRKKSDSKSGLTKTDLDLWKDVTRDIKPLRDIAYVPDIDVRGFPETSEAKVIQEISSRPRPNFKVEPKTGRRSKEIDRRTDERLRRGKLPIEGEIDLHGMNRYDARDALERFILRSHQGGRRCVLVVTGAGYRSPNQEGVLRGQLPEWLSHGILGEIVLKCYPAQPKDGGKGAFYVYLRRLSLV